MWKPIVIGFTLGFVATGIGRLDGGVSGLNAMQPRERSVIDGRSATDWLRELVECRPMPAWRLA